MVFLPPRILEEKEEKISLLERSLEELGDQADDKAQLLESIQSDKTALSRALTQNKELKIQLAELQNVFVKMVAFFFFSLNSFFMTLFTLGARIITYRCSVVVQEK